MAGYAAYKYNPAEMPGEELQAVFVARRKTLDRLMEAIREQDDAESVQHYLILGPRGMGKTTLLLMLETMIRSDPQLSGRWLPVRYREEEFSVYTLRDLFALALDYVSDQVEGVDVSAMLQEVAKEGDEERGLSRAIAALKSISQTTGKRILLMMDNFDRSLPERTSSRTMENAFRRLLSTESFLMVIGTSVLAFEDIADYDEAFFNFFSPVPLDELSEDQLEELLRARARLDGNDEFLGNYERHRGKIRAITHLTGGNPRLVLMLYDTLSRRGFLPVVEALRETIDSLTPVYRAGLENLPRQQSKILDTLMRLEGVASPTAIAQEARLELNAVTTQLGRLKDRGFVEAQGKGRGNPAMYRVRDQMFRTWYQMRYLRPVRRRVELFVQFLRDWFSVEERHAALSKLSGCCRSKRGEIGKAMENFTKVLEGKGVGPHGIAAALLNRGLASEQLGNTEAASDDFQRCAESRINANIVYRGLLSLIRVLCEANRLDEAMGWATRTNELEPEDALLHRRVETRISLLLSIAQGGSLENSAKVLEGFLEESDKELRERLSFLSPALEFARSGDEASLAKIPEEEQRLARIIAKTFQQRAQAGNY